MLPILLGSLAGLALGLVGGGGSILTVPLLVGVLDVPAREATTMSLVIVGITALWGSVPHARRGHVLWGRAAVFGAVGLVGTLVGGYLNGAVPQQALLGGFVVLMVVAASAMWRRAGARSTSLMVASSRAPVAVATAHPVPMAAALGGRDALMRGTVGTSGRLVDSVPFVATAVGVGLLTGFFGVGGGFLIVPALVLVLHLPMHLAIGTSLPIIAINSGTALLGHLGSSASIDVPITVLFTVGAITGALVGGALSNRLPSATLARSFALVVLLLAGYLAIQVIRLGGS